MKRMCVAVVFAALTLTALPAGVDAQDRGGASERARKKAPRKTVPKKNETPASTASSAPKDAKSPAPTSEGEVKKEGDAEVKVLEFSGLDIEGQLKTPQMLYFLRRLRAEFGRPNLPHRSFLPELEQTTKDEAF